MNRILTATVLTAALALGATVPRPAGEFGFELPNGKQVLLTPYRGKVVLLAFFSTTCPHCQQSSMMMERLQAEFGPKGFQALGACFNDMAKLLTPEFIQRHRLTYPVGYTTQDPVLNWVQHTAGAVPYVPIFVFIDRKGTIRAQYGGEADFFKNQEANTRKMIQDLLKEGAAGR